MIWLNHGTIFQIEPGTDGEVLSCTSKSIDSQFSIKANSCGQIFNMLCEDKSKFSIACEEYYNIFKDGSDEHDNFCSLCFLLTQICYFSLPRRNLRPNLIELLKRLQIESEESELIKFLCQFFIFIEEKPISYQSDFLSKLLDKSEETPDDFPHLYIKKGGTREVLQQILLYQQSNTTESWLSEIEQYQPSFSEFDQQFFALIRSDADQIECHNYCLSILLNNFLDHKSTTHSYLLQTFRIPVLQPTSLQDRLIAGIFGFEQSTNLITAYEATNDVIFAVHFLHLLTLKPSGDVTFLTTELDIAVYRYSDLIISDYDESRQSGLRTWVPSYLNIVSQDIRAAVQLFLPAIQNGMAGPFIEKMRELPSFTFVDSTNVLKLNSTIEKALQEINESQSGDTSPDEAVVKDLVQHLNELYSKCDEQTRLNLLMQLHPYLEILEGLNGSVISSMLDIRNMNVFEKEDDPGPILQSLLFDIITSEGKIPELQIV